MVTFFHFIDISSNSIEERSIWWSKMWRVPEGKRSTKSTTRFYETYSAKRFENWELVRTRCWNVCWNEEGREKLCVNARGTREVEQPRGNWRSRPRLSPFGYAKKKKKKKGEEITRSETMNFWSTDDKKPVWESHSTYLSRFLFAQFSLEEEEEEEESLVLLFLSYFYFAIVGRDVRIDPSFHINFRSKEIEFHREQKIFSISYFFF